MAAWPPDAKAASKVRLPSPKNSPRPMPQPQVAGGNFQDIGANPSSPSDPTTRAARKHNVDNSAEISLVHIFWSRAATPQNTIGRQACASHPLDLACSWPALKK